jgi:sulfatase maturation enzyme AslB (radical SAM superfamily)
MFCRFLSNTYHFTYDHVKPCCWIKHTPETQIKILDPNLKEKLDNIRKIDTWIPECSYCHDLESAGTSSPRTQVDINGVHSSDDVIGDPLKVELQLDEDCNAACLMCGTWNSTTWQQYEDKTIKGRLYPSYRWKTNLEERINVVENTIDFDKTKQLNFFGGEPFNSGTQLRMLKLIKYPENVSLVYTTNGSVFPCNETLELWKDFKKIHIGISIDGVGDQFNYLRWPLQWHQVEDNLLRYFELPHTNISLNSSFTATPFNILYIDRYTEWAIDFAKKHKTNKTDLTTWFLNPQPVVDTINMNSIPPALQQAVKDKYGENSRIAKIMSEFNVQKCLHMINYVNFHDRHRKLDWRTVFPEIVGYFDVEKIAPLPKKKVWEIKRI